MTMNIGILGAGVMGSAHIKGFRSLNRQNAEYYSIFDIDPQKRDAFADTYGLKTYPDMESMLGDGELDVIDLCLPSFMHEEYALKIAAAGKHMLIEKPVAFTVEAVKNIFDTARRHRVRVMAAQVIRFWPEYARIKEMYDGGELGEVITVYAARLSQLASWSEWYRRPQYSGEALLNLTLHDIDFLHYLLGKPVSVYSAGYKNENDSYNDVMNIFKFDRGITAMVDGSSNMTPGYPFTMRFRLLATKGTVEYTFVSGENIGPDSASSLMWYPKEGKSVRIDVPQEDPYGREVRYFADCILNGEETAAVSEQSVLDVTATVTLARESLHSGKVHPIP
ncbi:MAG: Gfo/Idh/MocA family oxidoreductase [Bacteroidales bacterium]|jgi:predicted dehydrogenase|nr:Gfo/Idh/MocA family oxidoreductase [Bacteroidales bacterium]